MTDIQLGTAILMAASAMLVIYRRGPLSNIERLLWLIIFVLVAIAVAQLILRWLIWL